MKSKAIDVMVNSNLNLKTCTVDDLQAIPGIGPKTARFFLLHTRPDAMVACLDTHILKFLRINGHDAPVSTPSGKRYLELERIYLDMCVRNGWNPAEKDIQIWRTFSGN